MNAAEVTDKLGLHTVNIKIVNVEIYWVKSERTYLSLN